MNGSTKPDIGVIGAGKVGSTLAHLLYQQGYKITAVYSRTQTNAQALANQVNAVVAASASDVVKSSQITLLTVTDDAVESVAGTLEIPPGSVQEHAVVHTSGALGLTVLNHPQLQGAAIGGIHPVFPFADVASSIKGLPGSTFGIEASNPPLRQYLINMAEDLDGQIIELSAESRALYHAAMVFVSNYVVGIYGAAERLLQSIGADKHSSTTALNGLLSGTLDNLLKLGTPHALTGPLVRKDVKTIQAHIAALEPFDPALASAYRKLAQITLPLLEQRGISVEDLSEIINQDHNEHYATDNS